MSRALKRLAAMQATTLLAVVLTVLLATLLVAQEPTRILPGARVRVTAPHLPGGRLQGALTRVDADTLVIGSTPVALHTLTRLEVSTGRRSHWRTGLGVGFLVGAGLGAILGASVGNETGDICTATECALAGAGIVGTGGMVVGALVGAMTHTDRWQEVPVERVGVRLFPQRNGSLSLTVSLAF